jgi:hypothetical protein
VLFAGVWRAEVGRDPLGTGKALGLLDLYAGSAEEEAPPPGSGPTPPAPATYKSESTTFTLKPGQAFEYKYRLEKGLGMVFAWTATGILKQELHSDPENSSMQVISHDKRDLDHAAGTLTAPFGGIHGWYWENASQSDVTITLNSAGFYSEGFEMRAKFDPVKHKNRIERIPHTLTEVR